MLSVRLVRTLIEQEERTEEAIGDERKRRVQSYVLLFEDFEEFNDVSSNADVDLDKKNAWPARARSAAYQQELREFLARQFTFGQQPTAENENK